MTIDEAEKIKTVIENKDYIVQLVNAVAKNMIEAFENLKIEDVNMFQLGYNKAIDDFVKLVKEHQYLLSDVINSKDYGMFTIGIEQIAEQLKAGEKNGRNGNKWYHYTVKERKWSA